ncbi:MAG TPA: hypothetical protein VM450_13955, partial [Thermomicrobiales bacterium]|nr:hypothetical protein [Thermomicrobiales bacterium]
MWQAIDGWLVVAVVVIVLNVVPAFMPPTWAVLAYFHVQSDYPVIPLALLGTACAMAGRALLALLSRRYGTRLVPKRWQANIASLVDAIGEHKLASLSALGVFALGPVPSEQLFIAVGIAKARLLPVLAVFGAGRLLAYTFWVSAADTAATSLEDVLTPRFGGGVALAAQVLG